MTYDLQSQVKTYTSHLNALIGRGRQLRDALAAHPADKSVMAATRAWQEECGVTVNQLSGGSKAHWLARSFSKAFLVRSASGLAAEGAPPAEIVTRLLDVLEQARASLSQNVAAVTAVGSSSTSEPPAPRRFEFVHNAELRPIVEQAFADARQALEQGRYEDALRTACGILEAIVTDALEHKDALEQKGLRGLAAAAPGNITEWSFETRLSVAEKVGLIRGGCARLPTVARRYRDHSSSSLQVSERDARQTAQVLRVIMRDLDPGR